MKDITIWRQKAKDFIKECLKRVKENDDEVFIFIKSLIRRYRVIYGSFLMLVHFLHVFTMHLHVIDG